MEFTGTASRTLHTGMFACPRGQKSPLEYLTPVEKLRQQDVVLQLITDPPLRVNDLIAQPSVVPACAKVM